MCVNKQSSRETASSPPVFGDLTTGEGPVGDLTTTLSTFDTDLDVACVIGEICALAPSGFCACCVLTNWPLSARSLRLAAAVTHSSQRVGGRDRQTEPLDQGKRQRRRSDALAHLNRQHALDCMLDLAARPRVEGCVVALADPAVERRD